MSIPDLSMETLGASALGDMDSFSMDLDISLPDHDTQPYTPVANHNANQQPPAADSSDGFNQGMDSMLGIGAGPLPTGFGMPSAQIAGTTLTEFTKRRNWSQRVLEELRDFLHILTPDGRIIWASSSCRTLTGYEPHQLQGRIVTEFIHQDDSALFVREFNESIATGNPLRFFYRFKKMDEQYTIFEAHGHPHLSSESLSFGTNSGAGFCRGFFMMSRPYPTKNAALLDSFLDHKIENERLTKRIAELKREEKEEQEAQERHWQKKQEGYSSVTPSETQRTEVKTESETPAPSAVAYNGMPPPAKPEISNTALTRQNLDEALAESKPDSINDKMARYEGANHYDTIEMLTGLRYRDGERSRGISTGDTSPALIRGDAGIPVLVDKDTRGGGDKKKKLKMADEYVCTDCGTLDSPEWRKGPSGPKSLCNACGRKYICRYLR